MSNAVTVTVTNASNRSIKMSILTHVSGTVREDLFLAASILKWKVALFHATRWREIPYFAQRCGLCYLAIRKIAGTTKRDVIWEGEECRMCGLGESKICDQILDEMTVYIAHLSYKQHRFTELANKVLAELRSLGKLSYGSVWLRECEKWAHSVTTNLDTATKYVVTLDNTLSYGLEGAKSGRNSI